MYIWPTHSALTVDACSFGYPQDASSATKAAHAIIREVWEVVDSNYLDARSTGFNRDRWAELRDEALAGSYRDTAAGYRCEGRGKLPARAVCVVDVPQSGARLHSRTLPPAGCCRSSVP